MRFNIGVSYYTEYQYEISSAIAGGWNIALTTLQMLGEAVSLSLVARIVVKSFHGTRIYNTNKYRKHSSPTLWPITTKMSDG